MTHTRFFIPALLLCFSASTTYAQTDSTANTDTADLFSLIDSEPETDYATASFKSTRVINGQSLETLGKGSLDFRISHRFGFINQGAYELFGLDNATQRMSFDYALTEQIQIGIGRSSVGKVYDGNIKYKFLRQSTGKRNMPVSALVNANMAIETLKNIDPNKTPYPFSNRLYYTWQLIVGRKFSDNFSLQIMPTLLHRNLVDRKIYKNDVIAIGVGGRNKISRRIAVNYEYFYVLPDQINPIYHNSLSLGLDIETGGHVFQLHFTNSTSMNEKGFIAENDGDWRKGDIHFGFNISRIFTLRGRR